MWFKLHNTDEDVDYWIAGTPASAMIRAVADVKSRAGCPYAAYSPSCRPPAPHVDDQPREQRRAPGVARPVPGVGAR
jgi:hypothetical protein